MDDSRRQALEAALRELTAAAGAVYDHDDAFTESMTPSQRRRRVARDDRLADALDRAREVLDGD